MACVGLLFKLGIHCTPSRSCQCHGGALATSISVQRVYMFFWWQSGLLVGHRDACLWVLSGWFPRCRVISGNAARRQCPPSLLWLVVPLWVSVLVHSHSAIFEVSILCCQCWFYKSFQRLALFVGHPRNSGAGVKHKSHRWKLGVDVMGERMKSWALPSWHWLVNSANNERFGHFQLGAHLFHPGFFAETLTKHLQLHLPCSGGSLFENGIDRALGPSGPIWSSSSWYPWNDKSCYGLWGQALCACILPNSDTMFWKLWW